MKKIAKPEPKNETFHRLHESRKLLFKLIRLKHEQELRQKDGEPE